MPHKHIVYFLNGQIIYERPANKLATLLHWPKSRSDADLPMQSNFGKRAADDADNSVQFSFAQFALALVRHSLLFCA